MTMKYFSWCLLFSAFLVSICAAHTAAQSGNTESEKTPAVAFLRYKADFTTIETIVEAKLVPRSKPTVSVYRNEGLIGRKIATNLNVGDCFKQYIPGRICKEVLASGKLKFIYRLSGPPENVSKYMVGFSIDDIENGEVDRLMKVSLDFRVVEPSIEILDPQQLFQTNNGRRTVTSSNGVIRIPIVFPENEEFESYIDERISTIYEWMQYMLNDPKSTASVKTESLSRSGKPKESRIVGLKVIPERMEDAVAANRLTIYLVIDQKFPPEEFLYELRFLDIINADNPAAIRRIKPPAEISGRMVHRSDGITNISHLEADDVGKDKSLSLRDFENNLDVGFAFRSYVEEVSDDDQIIRRRRNLGFLDLRYAPIINKPFYRKGINHLFTPFFLDAKVSTGQVRKRTLSLNRILLGTEYSLRWIPSTKRGNINKYIFSFRGINASDRDFKRVEGKFDFEFRPLLDILNRPLQIQYLEPASVLDPGARKRIATNWFGYQIQPFVGTELGRVYRARRDAFKNEEGARNIRRLYTGLDMLFNVSKHANIRLTDTLYYRGEVSNGKLRNFFTGEFDAPLFFMGKGSQSIYFRYERGDQPPFASPNVNSFRIGYRFTSNVLGRSQ